MNAKLKIFAGFLLIIIIRLYQYTLSPLIGNQCRFYPTCSHYAVDAIKAYGPLQGGRLAAKRLLKCHPWHEGGFDPVPEKKSIGPNVR